MLRGASLARSPLKLIAAEDLPALPRLSRAPRLPKGCLLQLKAGRPERWELLKERGPWGERSLQRLRRLAEGRPAWILKGEGPPADVAFPALGVARRELNLEATGYDPGPVDNTRGWVGSTRTGIRARFGVVAVDPALIPLGSRVYVEGYGPGLAADVGGAIKGRRIDLCFNSSSEAREWGRRRCRVWIVEPARASERGPLLSRPAGL